MTGDDRLVRQAIEHFDASRIPDGITASRYPSALGQYIPTFSLIWVAMVHDYWMHRDDPAYVRALLPGVRGVLAWYERQVDDTGLLGPLPWWPFVDWAKEWPLGRPPGAISSLSAMMPSWSICFYPESPRSPILPIAKGKRSSVFCRRGALLVSILSYRKRIML
jgi:hypothetical protein